MKVRGQHYVWRHYLEPWMIDGKIFCLREGNVFSSDPKNVAKQRDFYKLRELTSGDIKYVQMVAINKSPDHLKKSHNELLMNFAIIPKLHQLSLSKDDEAAKKALEEAVVNGEELLHGTIEKMALKYLNDLRSGNVSFYKDDYGAMRFIYFLCVQYMRTKNMREKVVASLSANKIAQIDNYDPERIWGVLSHIFATNMGWSFYLERKSYHPLLLKNNTNIPFITGDQPIINCLAASVETSQDVEFYYPITPRLALLYKKGSAAHEIEMTETDVREYNKMISSASHEIIFSDSEHSLSQFA